ncbi:MAG: polymer-forming cytoskeletal protein [Myxococcota bacterium]|nr:polymer-forming cytoskeletal protein [Myxococcota bacterium]
MKFARKDSLFAANPGTNGGLDDERSLPAPTREPVRPRGTSPATQLNAFLGRGCIYEGKLTFEGRVRIDGKFTGEIFSNDTLEVGPDAELEAEIDVATVIVAGRVDGNIKARGRCDLRAPGAVEGNITSPIITMDEGVRFDGEMRMRSALDEAVRATTQRAPTPMELGEEPERYDEPEELSANTGAGIWGEMDDMERPDAPAAPDPSDLLNPDE